MTIKKEIKKSVWLITDKNSLPIKSTEYRKLIKDKSFPNNFICEFEGKILVFLNFIKDFTKTEFNHNLIWVGTKLYKFCNDETYEIANPDAVNASHNIYLGWSLGHYNFENFKSKVKKEKKNKLLNIKKDQIIDAECIKIVRDLINSPANVMGPNELNIFAKKALSKYVYKNTVIEGKNLKKNFPLIYSVGRGAENDRRPIFSEFIWKPKIKKTKKNITLIGKGVCFDTGGLNLKLGSGMNLMKKDMGGAANCIGLSRMLIKQKIEINLRLLLPIVENSLSSKAFRPSDIIKSRSGIFVEIGDTDAEARLILGDALSYASEKKTDLIIDMATLTGASRVALGTDVPSFFSNKKEISKKLIEFSEITGDPLWELPLWKNYESQLESHHADIKNIGNSSFGGAITAALFLQKFVTSDIPWIHIDLMAWNLNSKISTYYGGEAMGIRALFKLIEFLSKN